MTKIIGQPRHTQSSNDVAATPALFARGQKKGSVEDRLRNNWELVTQCLNTSSRVHNRINPQRDLLRFFSGFEIRAIDECKHFFIDEGAKEAAIKKIVDTIENGNKKAIELIARLEKITRDLQIKIAKKIINL